ncbi:MAG: hypothetical protein IPP94_02690 [Ignavibacteria bacterium]|nr:hypothetical protein [Ignavibacteria bacterium]
MNVPMTPCFRVPACVPRALPLALALLAMAAMLGACSSSRCAYCEQGDCPPTDAYLYSVELKTPVADQCGGGEVSSLVTSYAPSLACGEGVPILRVDVPCAPGGDCKGARTYIIPEDQVQRITRVSDTKTPPEPVRPECTCVSCASARDGALGIGKLELRAMGAWRGEQSPVFYPDAQGGVLYEPETFSTGRGGTKITAGAELAALWPVLSFGETGPRRVKTDNLHLGLLTGVWPVDGSVFIPLSFHPRLTFNNHPDPYGCGCNAWYVFGDVGITFDGTTNAPIEKDKRVFIGLGIGYEIPLSNETDLGVDFFVRRTWLPLPEITCCPDVPEGDRNPVRISNVLGLRLGVTF